MATDLEIARSVTGRNITEVAEDLGLSADQLVPYGYDKAKIMAEPAADPKGKLILVSAITPTPAGEGKTTTSVALAQGLGKIGKKGCVVLREPSLGPCLGMKGGAAGGGHSQVIPMEDITALLRKMRPKCSLSGKISSCIGRYTPALSTR